MISRIIVSLLISYLALLTVGCHTPVVFSSAANLEWNKQEDIWQLSLSSSGDRAWGCLNNLETGACRIVIWNVRDGTILRSLIVPSYSYRFSVSKDEKSLAVACGDGSVTILDSASLAVRWSREVWKRPQHGFIPTVGFLDDGTVVTAGNGNQIAIVSSKTTLYRSIINDGNSCGPVVCGGNRAYVGCIGALVEVLSSTRGVVSHRAMVSCCKSASFGFDRLALSSDGSLLAAGCGEFHEPSRIWKATTGELVSSLFDRGGSVTSLRFSVDGRFLAVARYRGLPRGGYRLPWQTEYGGVEIWEWQSSRLVGVIDSHEPVKAMDWVGSVMITSDGRTSPRVWRIPSEVLDGYTSPGR